MPACVWVDAAIPDVDRPVGVELNKPESDGNAGKPVELSIPVGSGRGTDRLFVSIGIWVCVVVFVGDAVLSGDAFAFGLFSRNDGE